MARLVLRVSALAKAAALVAMIGGGVAVYGKMKGVAWASGAGTLMLFGGAIVWYIERFRMFKARRRPQSSDEE